MDLTAPCPAPFNLAAYVLAAGEKTPDKVALSLLGTDHTKDWTYATLTSAVLGTASGLLAQGLTPGDRVLMRLGNTVDFPVAYLASLAAGLVPVPTAAALSVPEVAKIIDRLQPTAILHDPGVACPDAKTIPLDDLRAMRSLAPAAYHMGDPERLGYIIYTSGTSGAPTAVMLAHRAIWARRMMFDGWYGLSQDDRVLHAGAFNWTYTLGTGLMDPWTRGATALIPAPGTPPAALAGLVKTHRASIFAAAPGVYRQMLRDLSPLFLPDLRHGLSAGEKMTAAVRTAWQETTDTAVYEAFGMSECSTFISGSPTTPAKDGAIGFAQPGRRTAILTAKGDPARTDTPGTIAIHRSDPGLALGYLDAPDQFAAKFEGDWFLTGDQGIQDGDGQITYMGRNDDMMNAGGFRVSPLEVEETLLGIPGVTAIGVTEVEVKKGTQVIAAFYTAAKPIKEYTLTDYAKEHLARYKQPRLYVHVDALPTSGNGKLLRRQLRTIYEATP